MEIGSKESFGSVSLVRQGEHSFYSLTLPSEILAETCYVVNRDDDPKLGFQRSLDKNRAKEIAAYIDSGLGTIPSSIVLSAQDDADLKYDSKNKTISFNTIRNAFLIIDGQHRVYGFMLAEKAFRVPVVIYSGLSKRDESRLFIDINSKQKGVPPELLLDIKKLADYENNEEELLRSIFDIFAESSNSVLYGRMSSHSKVRGSLTRTSFNSAVKPIVKLFVEKSDDEIFEILNNYIYAFNGGILQRHDLSNLLSNATVFKAICLFFPKVAEKVKDRFGAIYTVDNFYHFLFNVGDKIKKSRFEKAGAAYKPLVSSLEECLRDEFVL
ncbi:DGQHR domain-containing protein [Brenneria goodwinii]|uniref:DGQHR domain-containing protein n=1 Tax=Brenneria goodwinii TaxID=1109412 RepID=UPI0036E83057